MNRRPPRLGRMFLRQLCRDRFDEVEADLEELHAMRAARHGAFHAWRRYYADVASLVPRRRRRPGTAARRAGSSLLADARLDLRHAARLFARRRAIVTLTTGGLALGLGISTAVFTMLNAEFLRDRGVIDPDRAPGILRGTQGGVSTVWTYEQFQHLRAAATLIRVEGTLGDAAIYRERAAFEDRPAERVTFVSGGFFSSIGAGAQLGRTLEPGDERFDSPVPIVVSHRTWVQQLAADPSVIGRTAWLGRAEVRIVGVMPRGVTASPNRDSAFWAPLSAYGTVYGFPSAQSQRLPVELFGRLAPGVTPQQAEAELTAIAAALPGDGPAPQRYLPRLDPHFALGRMKPEQLRSILAVTFTLIGLVLTVAVANVATVLVASAMTRDREMGVRRAIGAGRGRILRQLLTEGLAFSALSAAPAVALAWWGTPLVARMLDAPPGMDFAVDASVLLFIAVAVLLVGIGAGAAPAWHGRGGDVLTPLKGESARSDRPSRRRLRGVLVATQAAASVILIVVAALLVRAAWNASTVDLGFEPRGVYGFSASLGRDAGADQRLQWFWMRALDEARRVPGVSSASLVEYAPFGDAYRVSSRSGQPRTYFNRTRADYFDTIGIRILAGRGYTPAEVASGAPVALVSESLARARWPEGSPIGGSLERVTDSRATIIGVVSDTITARLQSASRNAVYEPLSPGAEVFAKMIVRLEGGMPAATALRDRLQRIDARADVRIQQVEADVQAELARPRLLATLAGFVGAVAVALSVIGIYGLTAALVSQRVREIGIRVALGAERRGVVRLLLWDSVRPAVIGLAIGSAAVLGIGGVVAGTLYGVSARDPIALASAAILMLATSALAALAPSRRAAAVDPARVLRQS